MKKVISVIANPPKAVAAAILFLWTMIYSRMVFAQDSNTLGDVGNNVAESGTGIANMINIAAVVGGAAFFVIGLWLLASERQRSQKGVGGPVIMIVVGGCLLAWQYLAGTVNNTTLGSGATEVFLND